jgi:hypothetical protein
MVQLAALSEALPGSILRVDTRPVTATEALPPVLTEGRRRFGWLARFVVAGVSLLTVALVVWVGWLWRHPSAFDAYGGWGVGNSDWRSHRTLYVAMTYPERLHAGTLTIHGAHPHALDDSTDATVAYFLCTPKLGLIAIGSGSEIHQVCGALVPANGARMSPANQQFIVAITPSQRGGSGFPRS